MSVLDTYAENQLSQATTDVLTLNQTKFKCRKVKVRNGLDKRLFLITIVFKFSMFCSQRLMYPHFKTISMVLFHWITPQNQEARPLPGNTKRGEHHCTVNLLFDQFGITCMTTDNFRFDLQNRLIQTGQTGGQLYSDTSPFSVPCLIHRYITIYNIHKTSDINARILLKAGVH